MLLLFLDFIKIICFLTLFIFFIRYLFHTEFSSKKYDPKSFKCLRCGLCCRFKIILSKHDIDAILPKVLDRKKFIQKRFFLNFLEKKETGECVFLDYDKTKACCTCSIYEQRPKACQKFPEINYIFTSRADSRCIGIGSGKE